MLLALWLVRLAFRKSEDCNISSIIPWIKLSKLLWFPSTSFISVHKQLFQVQTSGWLQIILFVSYSDLLWSHFVSIIIGSHIRWHFYLYNLLTASSRTLQKVIMSCFICLADVKLTDTKTLAEELARLKKGQSLRNQSIRSFFICIKHWDDELLNAEPSSCYNTDDANHERLVNVARVTCMEDLQAPRNLIYAPLCIKVRSVLMS